jgi:hypothetical protein
MYVDSPVEERKDEPSAMSYCSCWSETASESTMSKTNASLYRESVIVNNFINEQVVPKQTSSTQTDPNPLSGA